MTRERIEEIIRKHVRCDATGLSPSVASVFLFGFDEAAREIAALNTTPPAATPGAVPAKRYRHKKRGTTYEVIGDAQVHCVGSGLTDYEIVTVYRSLDGEDKGCLWVRRVSEFHDGRFEQIAHPTQPEPAEQVARKTCEVPEGWKAVPVEPTQEMVRVAYAGQRDTINAGFSQAYREMVAAAPDMPAATPRQDAAAGVREALERAAKVADAEQEFSNNQWPEWSAEYVEGRGDAAVSIARTLRKLALASTPSLPAQGEAATGWLFHNPDTGVEFSWEHPVESGQVPDAENIRPANASNLHVELMAAWALLEDARLQHAYNAGADAMYDDLAQGEATPPEADEGGVDMGEIERLVERYGAARAKADSDDINFHAADDERLIAKANMRDAHADLMRALRTALPVSRPGGEVEVVPPRWIALAKAVNVPEGAEDEIEHFRKEDGTLLVGWFFSDLREARQELGTLVKLTREVAATQPPVPAKPAGRDAIQEGWTGRKCPNCKGAGLAFDARDGEDRACPYCGGTGDEYGPLPPSDQPGHPATKAEGGRS